MPFVSVVMAVHNGLPYVKEAIHSVFRQSLADFEFIIIDDASVDASRAYIESIPDERIKLLVNGQPSGLSRSLNRGIEASRGTYLARMDHDDVSLPPRLAQQTAFLNAHPDVDIVGTWATTIGRNPEQLWRYPTNDEDIRSEFVFNSCLVHSSVMWRREGFEKLGLRYDAQSNRAQDYELWTRAKKDMRFANIPQSLLRYRIHPGSVGSNYGDEQKMVANKVRERELAQLGVNATPAELALHHAVSRWELPGSFEDLKALETWLLKLHEANQRSGFYPSRAFGRALERRWWAACRSKTRFGLDAWRAYLDSPLHDLGQRGRAPQALFMAKAALQEIRVKR